MAENNTSVLGLIANSTGLFTNEPPIVCKSDAEFNGSYLTYIARQLSGYGLRQRTAVARETRDFNNKVLGWNNETESYPDTTELSARQRETFFDLLFYRGKTILMCDSSQKITCQTLAEWVSVDPEFIERCYEACVQLNPTLDPETYERLQAGIEAQKETKGADSSTANFTESTIQNKA